MTNSNIDNESIYLPAAAYAYLDKNAKDPHPYMETIREDCKNHKWNFMLTTKQQASLLHMLARLTNAKKILELGSYYGHSTLALASALPHNGGLISIEHNPKFAQKTREHLDAAGVGSKVEIFIGEASETLIKIEKTHENASFDFVFIDADKRNYTSYWETSLRLVRDGGMIAVDNVLARGEIFHEELDPAGHAFSVKRFNEKVLKDRRVHSLIAPVADGMLLAIKSPNPASP
jgi:predicted O-methyltransferase YrrM